MICATTRGMEELALQQPTDGDNSMMNCGIRPPKKTRAHVRIALGDVTPHNIKVLKRLNQVVFPVTYNDKFYKDVLESGELAKLAYYNDIVVGAACCRADMSNGKKRMYIMTLGCLAPYRKQGVGRMLLDHILNLAAKDGSFESVFLHVQISNDDAINFYKASGFEIVETKQDYYKYIHPTHAHVLEKRL